MFLTLLTEDVRLSIGLNLNFISFVIVRLMGALGMR